MHSNLNKKNLFFQNNIKFDTEKYNLKTNWTDLSFVQNKGYNYF